MLQYRILLLQKTEKKSTESRKHLNSKRMLLKRIYNPITAMGFSARQHCRHPIDVMGVVGTFERCL